LVKIDEEEVRTSVNDNPSSVANEIQPRSVHTV